jgi:hypothetical protein
MNEAGEVLLILAWCVAAVLVIALVSGAIIALWMLILGKFHRPVICPKCGCIIRASTGRPQPFSDNPDRP